MKRRVLFAHAAMVALLMCTGAAAQSGLQSQSEKQDESAPAATAKAGSQTKPSEVAASESTTAAALAPDQSTTPAASPDAGGATQTGQGTAGPAAGTGKISILDQEPPLYHGMLRYPKFYGDPNMDTTTIDGSFIDRQYMLGSWGGGRDTLAKHGLVVDASVTQAVQGVASGSGDGAKYFGSGDFWMVFDSGRAEAWPGGLVYLHFEGDWNDTVTGTGGLLPLNGDTIMPTAPSALALSELYIVQGLPSGFAIVVGKANWAAFADSSFFANNERTQFLHEGLINNAILGAFVPYTSLGAMLLKQLNPEVGVGVVVTSSNTKATKPGFGDLCGCSLTYGVAATWTPKFKGLPGVYDALAGYNTKSVTAFDVDPEYLIDEILGQVPVARKNDNYALTLGGTQYLKVNKDARRSDGLPVGLGPFFRFGIAPKDRNLIDRFYSVGLGGNGGFAKRFNDNWGVGWAGAHFSADLRRDILDSGRRVDSFEHAAEAFYNFALTPAMRTSFHVQYINSADPSRDSALVLALRLQVDL